MSEIEDEQKTDMSCQERQRDDDRPQAEPAAPGR